MTEEQQKLVENNIGIAHIVANRYRSMQYEFDEILSTAYLGLVKAAIHFDASKGFAFSTYASMAIRNEILRYARDNKKHKIVVSSLDATVDPEEKSTLLDIISDNRDQYDIVERIESFRRNVKYLGDIERRILTILIYNPDATQDDIAKIIGVSQSYVSRRMKSMRNKMCS